MFVATVVTANLWKMATFQVNEFCGTDFGCNDLCKLKKEQLFAVAEYFEVEVDPQLKKSGLIEVLIEALRLPDPMLEKREKEQARQDKVREQELQIELARIALDQEKLKQSVQSQQRKHDTRFDISSCLRLLPKFNQEEVGSFFDAFEKIAQDLDWPENRWTLLIQSVLEGKAQEAYAALDRNQCREYDVVKSAVLTAYEVVPEAYRQRFRSLRRKPGETYLDIARQQEMVFDRWLAACEVYTFQELRQLILLEQFASSVPRHIESHLNDLEVKDCRKAAMAADSYELTHKDVPWRSKLGRLDRKFADEAEGPGGSVTKTASTAVFSSRDFVKKPNRAFPDRTVSRGEVICHYCRKPGHMKSNCHALRRREGNPVALLASQPRVSFVDSLVTTPKQPPKAYEGFVSEGGIAVSLGTKMVPISILRDTGATQSLLVSGVIDLPPTTELRVSTPIKGVGGGFVGVPLHKVVLESNLVNGPVVVAVVPSLPVDGIDFVLGNDLAGTQVCVTPVVSTEPCEVPETLALEQEHPEVFTACVVTRSQSSKQQLETQGVWEDSSIDLSDTFFAKIAGLEADTLFSRETLISEQEQDSTLASAREQAGSLEDIQEVAEGFFCQDGVLMRKWRPPGRPAEEHWTTVAQIVLPVSFRWEVLRLAHETAMAGHLGIRKTQEKLMRHFYWPKLHQDVVSFCRSCHACQLVGKPNQVIPIAPLCTPPRMEEPFSRVLIDCVGPLPKTKKGNLYLLTIMDVATRFPEAVPLRNIKAKVIAEALLHFFSRFGLPAEVQHDRGSNFTSGLFQEVMHELGIKQIMSSAYHPQSQGAIERYHQTLKTMVKTYTVNCPGDWDVAMPLLLFAIRDSVNESTGFTPFELVYGHEVRGPLKMVKDRLLEPKEASEVLQYVAVFKDRLKTACELARDRLGASQRKTKAHYDKKAVRRVFSTGDKVLVLMPMVGASLGVKFCGPYTIIKKVSDLNYVISTPERRQKTRLCHVNLLKRYVERDTPAQVVLVTQGGLAEVEVEEDGEEDEVPPVEPVSARLKNSSAMADLRAQLSYLSSQQVEDVVQLVGEHMALFQDTPGLTQLVTHDVDTGNAPPIKQHPYRIHPSKWAKVKEELVYMEEIGAIEQGSSEWSSPLVPVPKPDQTVRPCIDYRKVNCVTRSDAYPIPRLEDCIDKIGHAQFVSKFDLLKGYWQVPLTERAQEVSAFVTPDSLYRCLVLPFGMKNAPATFQRLMNKVTAGLSNIVTYLDDVVVYSSSWADHVMHIKQLFERLEVAGLVVNWPKCEIGKGQVTYLGHHVGRGSVMPRAAKVRAILDFPAPRTKRQLMRILGMCGFYRRFVPNFAAVTAPLTNLLKKSVKFVWSLECQSALDMVKAILSSEPVLVAPDFSAPFKLAVDACDMGVGAVLMQTDGNGIDRPVAYFSKKLNRHQKRYSTIEKEALALVLAVQHFEIYVCSAGGDLVVYTDHNPLTFLAKFRLSNQRVFRWSLILQPYNLVLKHLPGRENVIADTLSRG